MARDYAKTPKSRSKKASTRGKSTQRRGGGSGKAASNTGSGSSWRSYLAGLFSGFFVSFIIYLANLPAAENSTPRPEAAPAAVAAVPAEPPKPRFDFYKMLPEQTIDGPVEPAEVAKPRAGAPQESYLLQAGSFRQRDDADRRRAELLLLGLEPKVEETNSDNGRWFRVYLGPFTSHSQMTRARSLTAAQDIDTLLLKRGNP